MEKAETTKYQGKDIKVNPELSEFILSLMQAFLKTGYYRQDHPEAKKARMGLYDNLKTFLKGRGEISFIAVTEGGNQEVFIGGISDDPIPVSSIMLKSMAEMFIPKFTEYFNRKNLSSFSMKKAISKDEFEKFIDIMTETQLSEAQEIDVREKLSMDLIKNEVLMVSTVFNIDLVGKGRKLPWRVEISISRLKRDLNLIPLYKNISEEKINEIRKMVFEDIIKPLNHPKLIGEMLVNLDLISGDLEGFDSEDFETKIIEHLDKKLLPEVSRELIESISNIRKAFDKLQEVELLVRQGYLKGIARKVIVRLIDYNIVEEDLFKNFVKNKVITTDEVPENIRNKILKHKSLESFLESPDSFFEEINKGIDYKEIKNKLLLLFEFLPSLFEMGRYKEILKIFAVSRKKGIDYEITHEQDFIESISKKVNKRAENANKDEQMELLYVLESLDKTGAFILVDMLDNGSRFIRRSVIELLRKKGPEIIPFVLARFEKKEGWYYLRNALLLLSNFDAVGPEIEDIFKRNLHHPEPNVRKEAVQGIANILGEESQGLLIPLLKDEDADVRKRVISSLGTTRCTSTEFLSFFVDVLKNKTGEDDTTVEQVINTIANIDIPPNKEPSLEDALIDMLKESSILKMVRKKSQISLQLKVGLIGALATLGTAKSLKILNKYTSDKNSRISKAASEAIEKIEKRLA